MNRKTYVEVNVNNIKENIKKLKEKYKDYKYHMAVVKADCYGHGIKILEEIIPLVNYLIVATLEEALEIRNIYTDVPILCLGVVRKENIKICIEKNITITINSYTYLEDIVTEDIKGLKVHIKINTGMNRIGIKDKIDFMKTHNHLKTKQVELEGLFTHIYDASNIRRTNDQLDRFQKITKEIDLTKIKMIHIFASDSLLKYPKLNFINGARFGINMYGLGEEKLLSTFKVVSEVIQINELRKNETVGYSGKYKAEEDTKVATVAIGYADGIIRKYTGNNAYINNKKYQIVGNICMDMLFIKVDDDIKVGDKVEIIKDNDHIREIANMLDTITYEIICNITKRVPRIYIN